MFLLEGEMGIWLVHVGTVGDAPLYLGVESNSGKMGQESGLGPMWQGLECHAHQSGKLLLSPVTQLSCLPRPLTEPRPAT